MNRKLIEAFKIQQVVAPAQRTTYGTFYNGVTTTSSGIDTQGYDQATFILNAGTCYGTVAASIFASDDNVWENATAVTGADMTTVTGTGNDNTVYVGNLQTKNTKRYLFCRSVHTAAAAGTTTTNYSMAVILGDADSIPVTQDNTVSFDV